MLAAMPPASSSTTTSDNSVTRDRGDACPGALRLHSADDGALARVRIPAGILTGRQARALADVAERLGDGRLDITSRGNIQVRGLGDRLRRPNWRSAGRRGLLPAHRHERVRNIVASPLSGLDAAHADGTGKTDVLPWAMSLDRLLCTSETATALSGRFLSRSTTGAGDMAALGADVTWCAAQPFGRALVRIRGVRRRSGSRRGRRAGRAARRRGLSRRCGRTAVHAPGGYANSSAREARSQRWSAPRLARRLAARWRHRRSDRPQRPRAPRARRRHRRTIAGREGRQRAVRGVRHWAG